MAEDLAWRCKVVEGGRKFAESTSARIPLGSAAWECVCPQTLSAGHSSGGKAALLNASGSGIKLCVPGIFRRGDVCRDPSHALHGGRDD